MNKTRLIVAPCLAVSSAFFTMTAHGNDSLQTIEQSVATKAEYIDQKHGVLLDSQERNELKMDLIIQQLLTKHNIDATTIETIAADAMVTYAITDITEQRRLLIKLEAQIEKSTGSGGTQPDYP